MIIVSASQFQVYFSSSASSLVGAFNLVKALVEAFSGHREPSWRFIRGKQGGIALFNDTMFYYFGPY